VNDVTVEHLPESTPTAGAGSGRQRILVLGASGFIGRRVVERLAAGDWAIPVAASHRTVLDAAVISETLQFDARQSDEMQNAVKGVAGIVNCITGDSKTIIASAQALFAACSRLTAAPRIVHLSTMMVYGGVTGTVDETSPFNGDWSAYSAAKIEVERMSRASSTVPAARSGPGGSGDGCKSADWAPWGTRGLGTATLCTLTTSSKQCTAPYAPPASTARRSICRYPPRRPGMSIFGSLGRRSDSRRWRFRTAD
jgi:NAD(P)-dependent dehydrogenase (short-subunit alcohol dehydrogenase family)